jgi:hypothetical protein
MISSAQAGVREDFAEWYKPRYQELEGQLLGIEFVTQPPEVVRGKFDLDHYVLHRESDVQLRNRDYEAELDRGDDVSVKSLLPETHVLCFMTNTVAIAKFGYSFRQMIDMEAVTFVSWKDKHLVIEYLKDNPADKGPSNIRSEIVFDDLGRVTTRRDAVAGLAVHTQLDIAYDGDKPHTLVQTILPDSAESRIWWQHEIASFEPIDFDPSECRLSAFGIPEPVSDTSSTGQYPYVAICIGVLATMLLGFYLWKR